MSLMFCTLASVFPTPGKFTGTSICSKVAKPVSYVIWCFLMFMRLVKCANSSASQSV